MKDKRNLSELCPGECARVRRLCTEGTMRRRFLDIGLVEGTTVECVGRSPCGDPTAYRIRGAVIAIRSEDASTVCI
ncbi:MAG TPA: ferrous iron transport protein A [Clostridiales bacterium]|nr:ferrous iron transport protein A [Clostridiales bacterium]